MTTIFSPKLWKNPIFLIVSFAMALIAMAMGVPYTFLYSRAKDQGFSETEAAMLNSVIGAGALIGELTYTQPPSVCFCCWVAFLL